MPLAGEMQPAAFFFPFVLLLLLKGGVLWLGIALETVAGLAAYALSRELGLGRLAALTGGALFALLWAWFRLVADRPGRAAFAGRVVAGGVPGLLIAAPQLLAFVDYLGQSQIVHQYRMGALTPAPSMPPASLRQRCCAGSFSCPAGGRSRTAAARHSDRMAPFSSRSLFPPAGAVCNSVSLRRASPGPGLRPWPG